MTTEEIYDQRAAEQGEEWRRWFAWHPAIITEGAETGRWVWLKHIYRRDFELGWGCSHHQRALAQPAMQGPRA
jgi:hypothetical protein